MKRLQPVIWTKGTFLSPQHLQLQDRFLENLLQFHLDSLSFRPWGFRTLQISREALAAGSLGISSGSGIFPDGLLFDIPGSDSAPLPKLLAECFEPDQTSLDIYLSVPQYRERGLNVATTARQGSTRYRAEVELFRDENTGLSEKPVQIARKNLRLLAEGESLDGFSNLRVARVRRTAAGDFQADPRFVPPLLNFHASDYLSADIANFWLLYTVNTAFPLFRHLFETRGGHPEELFAAMLSLAGSLTTFSAKVHPRDLPAYDHDNLGACFSELDEKLRLLLDTVVATNVVSLPLKLLKPSIYATSLDQDKYLVNTKMYLGMSAETSQAEIVNKTPNLVKICSASHIEHLVRQALPGVPLAYVPQPPGAIPVKLNFQYFALSQTGPAWESIQRARNFAAYVPGDLPNPQAELIIVLPQTN